MNDLHRTFQDHLAAVRHVRASTASERVEKLLRMKKWILRQSDAICRAEFDDFRKPFSETLATDIKVVLNEIDHAAQNMRFWMRPRRVPAPFLLFGSRSRVEYQSKGVVLILGAWNYPFNLSVGPLVSAVAAGNCVILKPSEWALQTAEIVHALVREVFPENEVSVQCGGPDVAEALLKLPFDHVFFTGSPEIGKKVMAAAAQNLSGVTLELGGQNPAVVDRSANLKDTAEKIIWGELLNAGQSCVSPNHIFVHRDVETSFISELLRAYHKQVGKANARHNPDLGRMINRRHYDRVLNAIRQTIDKGSEIVLTGDHDPDDCFIHPTIVRNVSPDAPLVTEEIFGPVIALLPYRDEQEIVDHIRRHGHPLCLYLFTRRKKWARQIIDATSSGLVAINETTVPFFHSELPFGGLGRSGFGRSHGHAGFLAFSNERSVYSQRSWTSTIKLIYPPYTPFVKRLIRWIVRYF